MPWARPIYSPHLIKNMHFGGWTRWPLGVPSDPKLSMILWFSAHLSTKLYFKRIQVLQHFFRNWFKETYEQLFSMSLLLFQLINHLLNVRTWVKHTRIQYHTGTDYSASSEDWGDTKKSQQGILSLGYDGIYLATTFILYSKSHFCEMNIPLVDQDLSLQLLWGRLRLHSRGCSFLPLIWPGKERCPPSVSLPASSTDSLWLVGAS